MSALAPWHEEECPHLVSWRIPERSLAYRPLSERKILDSRSHNRAFGKPLEAPLFRPFLDGVFRSRDCEQSRATCLSSLAAEKIIPTSSCHTLRLLKTQTTHMSARPRFSLALLGTFAPARGACIPPHGALFGGNAEADIHRALVRKVYLKGIIPDRLYCFATSRSMVNFTSSPTTAVGNFAAIPNAVRLIVVVPEKPE